MASIDGFQQQVKQDKWFRNLEDDMKLIIPYIEDKRVTDIAIGIGGELIVEGMGMGKQFTGIYFDDATTTRIIYASAAVLGVTISLMKHGFTSASDFCRLPAGMAQNPP